MGRSVLFTQTRAHCMKDVTLVISDTDFARDFSGEPIYEHYFNVSLPVYESCLSVSDLPDAYDVCPTAGVSDPGYMGFGFGSGSAGRIEPRRYYYGTVFLYRSAWVSGGETLIST